MFLRKSIEERSSKVLRTVRDNLGPETERRGLVAEGIGKAKIALFISHGMGQQLPFETMDSLAQGLEQAAQRNGGSVSAIRGATVLLSGVKTQRVELNLKNKEGIEQEIHIYEGYWAPITEGQVTIRDVISFLIRGGLNGIGVALAPFQRWMFDRIVSFGQRYTSALWLLIAFGVLLSLGVFNVIVPIAFGDRLAATVSGTHVSGGLKFSDAAFSAVTTILALWTMWGIAASLLLSLIHSIGGSPSHGRRVLSKVLTPISLVFFAAWILYTFIAGLAVPFVIGGYVSAEWFVCPFFKAYSLVVWAALLIGSWGIREIMIQYPGDVAAYVATHTLDRFADIRTKIKARVLEVLKAIYEDRQYSRVAIVGHSLGSVVVYDALNTMIIDDHLNEQSLDVVGRTKLLLTFGSPLDRVAFIFASQWANTTATREAVVASFQPLILKYHPFRDIKWINIYSPMDIISSKLEFYDDEHDPTGKGRTVINVRDEDATTPLFAHIEYWRNPTLFDQLYANF